MTLKMDFALTWSPRGACSPAVQADPVAFRVANEGYITDIVCHELLRHEDLSAGVRDAIENILQIISAVQVDDRALDGRNVFVTLGKRRNYSGPYWERGRIRSAPW